MDNDYSDLQVLWYMCYCYRDISVNKERLIFKHLTQTANFCKFTQHPQLWEEWLKTELAAWTNLLWGWEHALLETLSWFQTRQLALALLCTSTLEACQGSAELPLPTFRSSLSREESMASVAPPLCDWSPVASVAVLQLATTSLPAPGCQLSGQMPFLPLYQWRDIFCRIVCFYLSVPLKCIFISLALWKESLASLFYYSERLN